MPCEGYAGRDDITNFAMSKVLPVLHRQLLRLARGLDAYPLSKALLLAQPDAVFDRSRDAVVSLPKVKGAAGEWARLLSAFNGGEYYRPESSAVAAVRAARHQPAACDAVDLGLLALRNMAAAAAAGEALRASSMGWSPAETYPAPFPAKLRRGTTVRSGSLLVAHPIACLSQPTLHHAVILVLDVDDVSVMGVVVNKPLAPAAKPEGVALGEAVGDGQDGDREGVAKLGPLGASRIFTGGDVQQNALLLLHDSPSCAHSASVGDEPSLFYTSRADALRDALGSSWKRERVKACAGYAGWRPAQLEQELARGVWFLLEADDGESIAPLALAPLAAGQPAAALRDSLWSGAVAALGGEHGALAGCTGDHDTLWTHLEAAWEAQTEELRRRLHERELDERRSGKDPLADWRGSFGEA